MAPTPDDVHLTGKHRDTLARIFAHPISHNIEWPDVLSLWGQVGTVDQRHDGRYEVTIGDESATFDRPRGKDIDAQQVLDVRHMLERAGYAPGTNEAKRKS